MKPGEYIYSGAGERGPDGAGVTHYSASRRRVERVSGSTVTLGPMECTQWCCHTPRWWLSSRWRAGDRQHIPTGGSPAECA
jgi:hypothetical protein